MKSKICSMCAEEKNTTEFYKNRVSPDGLFGYCKPCTNQQQILFAYKRRKKIIEHYGGKCECCGEDHYEFMAIEHIFENGTEDIKKSGGYGKMLAKIAKHKSPEYRVLCHNCNMSTSCQCECDGEAVDTVTRDMIAGACDHCGSIEINPKCPACQGIPRYET